MFILRALAGYWPALLIVILAQTIQTLASLALPTLNARIIDHGVTVGDTTYIWHTGGLMVATTLIQAAGQGVATYYSAKTAMSIGRDLRRDTFARVLSLSPTQTRHFGPPSLITRTTNDVVQIQNTIFFGLIIMIQAPIMGIGGIIMALAQDIGLSLLLVLVIPLLLAVIGGLMAALRPLFILNQRRLDTLNTAMREQLTGVRVIRAFVRHTYMLQRFTTANDNLRAVSLKIGGLFALMFPAIQLIIGASTVAVTWFGAHRIDSGAMEIGAMTAFLSYLMQILMAVMMSAMVFIMIPRAEACATRIREVLATTPDIQDPTTPKPLPATSQIQLHDVSVHRPGATHPILEGITLGFAPGSTTGIIGSTGCGKTTLISLLPRDIDPTAGSVTIGGVDIREVSLEKLRSRIAIVPQKAYLLSGTIAQTIAGADTPDPQRVEAALRAAQAWDFVSALPEGINAPVEAGGTNFSGGQRQRLTIARALYTNADIYIFDDSFSALDYGTDARLRAGLRDAIGPHAAVIIVAQRVASIRHADSIVVLNEGHVVGQGTHQDLLGTCEVYQEIVASQLTAKEAQQ